MLPITEEQVISHVKLQIGVELGVIVHKACTPGFFPYKNRETKLLAVGRSLQGSISLQQNPNSLSQISAHFKIAEKPVFRSALVSPRIWIKFFFLNADPDPGSKTKADKDPSQSHMSR